MGIGRDYDRLGNTILIGTELKNREWGHSDTDSVQTAQNRIYFMRLVAPCRLSGMKRDLSLGAGEAVKAEKASSEAG